MNLCDMIFYESFVIISTGLLTAGNVEKCCAASLPIIHPTWLPNRLNSAARSSTARASTSKSHQVQCRLMEGPLKQPANPDESEMRD